jgi:hypothetical protein
MVGNMLVIRIPIAAPPTTIAANDVVALEECGIESKAVHRLRKSGELTCRKLGRTWYTTRSALAALIKVPSPAEASCVVPQAPDRQAVCPSG